LDSQKVVLKSAPVRSEPLVARWTVLAYPFLVAWTIALLLLLFLSRRFRPSLDNVLPRPGATARGAAALAITIGAVNLAVLILAATGRPYSGILNRCRCRHPNLGQDWASRAWSSPSRRAAGHCSTARATQSAAITIKSMSVESLNRCIESARFGRVGILPYVRVNRWTAKPSSSGD
jgi:hypothetical protein